MSIGQRSHTGAFVSRGFQIPGRKKLEEDSLRYVFDSLASHAGYNSRPICISHLLFGACPMTSPFKKTESFFTIPPPPAPPPPPPLSEAINCEDCEELPSGKCGGCHRSLRCFSFSVMSLQSQMPLLKKPPCQSSRPKHGSWTSSRSHHLHPWKSLPSGIHLCSSSRSAVLL